MLSLVRARCRIASAATASVALHAALLGLILLVIDHVRPAQRPPDYIYVTMAPAYGRPGPAPSSYRDAPAAPSAPLSEPSPSAAARHPNRHRTKHLKSTQLKALTSRAAASPTPGTDQLSGDASSMDGTRGAGQQPSGNGAEGHDDSPIPGDLVDQPPALLSSVTPDYPEAARDRGIEGVVLLEIVIAKSGNVEDDVRVLESIPSLDQAAITAVRRWRFSPGRDHGLPVRVLLQIPLRFTLQASDD